METGTVTEDRTYNGWANRATWLVNLHLTNDQYTYLTVRAIVGDAYQSATVSDLHPSVRHVVDIEAYKLGQAADALRETVEEMSHMAVGSEHDHAAHLMVRDLIGWALADVDWREIAEGLLEE